MDLEYRRRNSKKALGEVPDVEDLIKSARFGEATVDEEAPMDNSFPSVPGPLHGGSRSCVTVSIDGYSALLRSKKGSLSQAEEVHPIEDDEDPETPWIPTHVHMSFVEDHPDGSVDGARGMERGKEVDRCVMLPPSKKIGADVIFGGLDASASDILENPEGRDIKSRMRASFDPPFERGVRNGEEETGAGEEEAGAGEEEAGSAGQREEAPGEASPLKNNPFAPSLDDWDRDKIRAEILAGK